MSKPALSLDEVSFVGEGLYRPECVLATRDGTLFTADWNGGIARIGAYGTQSLIAAQPADPDFLPNGFALCRDGSFLVACLSDKGGVWRLARDGALSPFLIDVDGERVPAANFVMLDERDRAWVTVSTRREPRAEGYRPDVDDGYIALVDEHGARIVADGLGYTNEVCFDSAGAYLYVNETFTRRLSRLPVRADGSLGEKEVVVEFEYGIYPDGMAFDVEGGVWIVSIVSNQVIRVAPDGSTQIMLADTDDAHVAWAEEAWRNGSMGRPHLDNVNSEKLRNISSIAFGGPDMRTIYLGCLLGDKVASLRSPIAGRKPVHWDYPT